MVKYLFGRIMGGLQLIFWLLLIPLSILTIPVALFYLNHPTPVWLGSLFHHSWVDWRIGITVIFTILMLIISSSIIWLGWHLMHPISKNNEIISGVDRLTLVKSFSKSNYLRKLQLDAKKFHKKRCK